MFLYKNKFIYTYAIFMFLLMACKFFIMMLEAASPPVIDQRYKYFTYMDIEAAMKFHKTKRVIIDEGHQPYFVDKEGREIILFTKACIEFLDNQKRRQGE